MRSQQDASPSKGHLGVKTIMTTILKGHSKQKCWKLASSNGPSEWRISKDTTDGYFGPHDSLLRLACWRCLHKGIELWRRRALQETVVWSSTPFNPSKLSLRRVNTLKGLRHILQTSLQWPFAGPLSASLRTPSGLPEQGLWEFAHWQNVGSLALALHGQPSLSPQEALTIPTQDPNY